MTKLHVLCTNIDNIGDKHLWQDDRLNTILRFTRTQRHFTQIISVIVQHSFGAQKLRNASCKLGQLQRDYSPNCIRNWEAKWNSLHYVQLLSNRSCVLSS